MISDWDYSKDGCKGTPQAELGRQTAGSGFLGARRGKSLLCNPFSTTPRLQAGACVLADSSQLCVLWAVCLGQGGCAAASEFTSQASQKGASWSCLLAWSEVCIVCVGGSAKPPGASRLPQVGCSPSWLGGAPSASHKCWGGGLHKGMS